MKVHSSDAKAITRISSLECRSPGGPRLHMTAVVLDLSSQSTVNHLGDQLEQASELGRRNIIIHLCRARTLIGLRPHSSGMGCALFAKLHTSRIRYAHHIVSPVMEYMHIINIYVWFNWCTKQSRRNQTTTASNTLCRCSRMAFLWFLIQFVVRHGNCVSCVRHWTSGMGFDGALMDDETIAVCRMCDDPKRRHVCRFCVYMDTCIVELRPVLTYMSSVPSVGTSLASKHIWPISGVVSMEMYKFRYLLYTWRIVCGEITYLWNGYMLLAIQSPNGCNGERKNGSWPIGSTYL